MSELQFIGYNNIYEDGTASYERSATCQQYIDAEKVDSSRAIAKGEFFQKLESYKEVNIFVCGVTEKSDEFISELNEKYAELLYGKGIKLRLIGVSDENNFVFVPNGLKMDYYKESLNGMESSCTKRKIYGLLESSSLENLFFVDFVSDSDVVLHYNMLGEAGVTIVNGKYCSVEKILRMIM